MKLSLKWINLPFCIISLFHLLIGTETAPSTTLLKNDNACIHKYTKENYSDGDTWLENRCRHCTCVQGRRVCSEETCMPLDCPEDQQVRRQGACCLTCIPIPPPEPRDCLIKSSNATYKHKETWKLDACTTCTCEDGESMCAVQDCAPAMCKSPVTTPGQCCPKCRRQECWDTKTKKYRKESKYCN